jgi:hypothetical protein
MAAPSSVGKTRGPVASTDQTFQVGQRTRSEVLPWHGAALPTSPGWERLRCVEAGAEQRQLIFRRMVNRSARNCGSAA